MEEKRKNEGAVKNTAILKSVFLSLKWFEWIMFVGIIVIGFYPKQDYTVIA